MDRGNRKILLASTFLALPLALIAVSLSTGAQPQGGFVLPGQQRQVVRQVAANEPVAKSAIKSSAAQSGGPLKPGGIVHALGKAASSATSGESKVQPTGLLDGLLGKNKNQKKAQANQKQNASRPAPNWSGIPFHAPTRNSRNQVAPIRDLAAPVPARSLTPSLPAPSVMVQPQSIVRRSTSTPIQARPTAAKITSSQPVLRKSDLPLTSRRVVTRDAVETPTESPLSRTTSNRRSGRQAVSPLDPSEVAARSTTLDSISADKRIENELVPKVSRRMLTPKPAPEKVVAKPVPTLDVTPANKPVKAPEIVAAPEVKKPAAVVETVSPKVVAKPQPAPAPTTLAAPSTPEPKLSPLPPVPTQSVRKSAEIVSHRAGPPESSFEPRRVMDGRPVRPLTPSTTMNVALPIGSGVADSSNNESTMDTSPMRAIPSAAPEARIAQRPQVRPQSQSFARDPYSAGNIVPQAQTRNGYPVAQNPSAYQPLPAIPVERAEQNIANNMRRERQADPGQTSVASELPGIRVMTHGPREITIRQTHQFEIHVENRGSIDAKGVMVRASIPDWAEMRGQNATRGDIAPQGEKGEARLVWTIEELPAGSSERMFVRVRAKRSGTHGLDVDWTLAPQKSVTKIHVHEPELQLTIEGPSEIIFGQSQTYKVRVLNPGDGIAPNVVFTLSPNSSTPQTQRIGDIPPGKEAQFEVELTAQDLGDLKIDGLASGDLELRADASKTIRVSAADLEALFSGPEVKYQDTDATYTLQVQNKGRATSEKVVATLKLPAGVKYLGGLDGVNQRGDMLQWELDALAPGTTRDYQFRCNMNTTGDQTFQFSCKGTAAGRADVAISTVVESISDLVMTINDPAAPAPVGSEVGYEIVIRNRGSRAATDVRAIAQFSHGIEPLRLKGHSGEILTGQVLFDPIKMIEPGQEVRLKVVAEADRAGHHRFRSEIRSGDTVLVAEEATHYMSPRKERVSRRSSDEAVKAR